MARPLRYTTFAPGELAARLRELSQKRAPGPGVPSPESGGTFSRASDPRTEERPHAPESKEAQSIAASTEEQADERQ